MAKYIQCNMQRAETFHIIMWFGDGAKYTHFLTVAGQVGKASVALRPSNFQHNLWAWGMTPCPPLINWLYPQQENT